MFTKTIGLLIVVIDYCVHIWEEPSRYHTCLMQKKKKMTIEWIRYLIMMNQPPKEITIMNRIRRN